MPEEHNRVLTDHAADLLLAPTEVAADHLHREGLGDRTVVVGDVMTDALYKIRDSITPGIPIGLREIGLQAGEYFVATIHRAENTDNRERLAEVLDALSQVEAPVLLLAHPRLVAKAKEHGLSLQKGSLLNHAPLTYPDLVSATLASRGVITDSGGLQKEAFLLRVPCTTVRTETEWPETVDLGWNILVDDPMHIPESVMRPRPNEVSAAPYGDGHAAANVVAELLRRT